MVTQNKLLVRVVVAVLLVGAAAMAAVYLVPRLWTVPGSGLTDPLYEEGFGHTVVVNDRTFFIGPDFRNKTNEPITIRSVKVAKGDSAVAFVDIRVYQMKDFDDAYIFNWCTTDGKRWDPATRPSRPVVGANIGPKQNLAGERGFTMLEFRVPKVGAWKVKSIEVVYEQNGRRYRQELSTRYGIVVAPNPESRGEYNEKYNR